MPGFTLTVALVAAAAVAISKYFSGDKDDGHSPPRDSYHSSSSYNSGTWSQTQQSYRPPPQPYRPPPPRYSYYTPETNAQSKTTTRSPAPPDYSRDVYRESVASTRTLRQTQPSTRTQASRPYSSFFDHVPESPEYGYPHTSSHHCHICAGSESRLPTAPTVVSTDLYSDEPAIVEDLDYAKKLREKARRKGLEMSEARSRAKSAQKKGSRGAAHIHKQEAMVRESEMKDLDKRAAKIIFRENNKVSCQRFSNGCPEPLFVLES